MKLSILLIHFMPKLMEGNSNFISLLDFMGKRFILIMRYHNKTALIGIRYDFDELKECGTNQWLDLKFYQKLGLFTNQDLSDDIVTTSNEIPIESDSIENLQNNEYCQNIPKEIHFIAGFNADNKLTDIRINVYYQEKTTKPIVNFSYFPIKTESVLNVDITNFQFNQENVYYRKSSYLKFGILTGLGDNFYVKMTFPTSRLFIKNYDDSCYASGEKGLYFEDLNFGENLYITCSIKLKTDQIEEFCSNYKGKYEIFSNLKRY